MLLRAIRFITQGMNDRRGLSLVETVIAAAILAIISAPVVTGFFVVAQNQARARHMYMSALLAESLLAETRSEWDKTPDIISLFAEYASGVNDLGEFLPDFIHDDYVCSVALKKSSGEVYFFTEDFRLDDPYVIEVRDIPAYMEETSIRDIYSHVISGSGVDIPLETAKSARILHDVTDNGLQRLHINNDSGLPAVLHLIGTQTQSPDDVMILYESAEIPLLVQYFEMTPDMDRMYVTVSVYDKELKLLKRLGTVW